MVHSRAGILQTKLFSSEGLVLLSAKRLATVNKYNRKNGRICSRQTSVHQLPCSPRDGAAVEPEAPPLKKPDDRQCKQVLRIYVDTMAENGDTEVQEQEQFSFTAAENEEYESEGPTEDAVEATVDAEVEGDDTMDDTELEAIKARVREMEEEAEKLKEMQSEVEKQMNLSSSSATSGLNLSMEEKAEADARSVYVGNVDYGSTAEELEAHFHGCGSINRVTILCDKFTGHPKGFAYIEFVDKDSVATAQALDESLFRGRQIKVSSKRTNRPGISTTNRTPRRFRRPRYYSGGYQPRRARYRSRRTSWYSPY